MTVEFRFGLRKRLYNYNMKLAREEKGLTMRELAGKVGCCLQYLYQIQAFKLYPTEELQERIAVVLGVPVDNLFPEGIKDLRITKSASTIDDCTITLTEAKQLGMDNEMALLTEGWEDDIDRQVGLRETIDGMLHTLTTQEEFVLKDRFGLGDDSPMTLAAVGVKYRLTTERIRQIEAKALRKLRHPARSNHLKDYIN